MPRFLSAALLAFVLLVAPADAQDREGGLQVDPESPSGREYALPEDQARRDAAPGPGAGGADGGGAGGSAGSPGSDAPPLFGAGVEPAGSTPSESGSQGSDRAAAGGGSGATGDRSPPPGGGRAGPTAKLPVGVVDAQASPDGGTEDLLLIGGGAAALLLAAAGVGLVVRRRTTS